MVNRLAFVLIVGMFSRSFPPNPPKKPAVDKDIDLKLLDESFNVAAEKIDRESRRQRLMAAEKRIDGFRSLLKTATKTGDFDKATKVKARISELEAIEPGERAVRPKEVSRFKGHTYALIKEGATWHVAKRKCEEMGGRLVCIENGAEAGFISSMCGRNQAWVGASDEEREGQWVWVNNTRLAGFDGAFDNAGGIEHHLCWTGDRWNDLHAGTRSWFVCEWET